MMLSVKYNFVFNLTISIYSDNYLVVHIYIYFLHVILQNCN